MSKYNIYLKCYLNKNLGDDLFLKIFVDKYTNNINTFTTEKYDVSSLPKNLYIKYINHILYSIINKISVMLNRSNIIEDSYIRKNDFMIVIGGSIFMEQKKNALQLKIYQNAKKYYILGANIGPYYTKRYLNSVKNIIDKSEDTCLRDKKSYDLVKESVKVRFAPDIIFSLDVEKYLQLSRKKIAISVINCDKKANQIFNPNQKQYEKILNDIICYYLKKGYEIKMFSFCKGEGDEITINNMFEKYNYDQRIKKYFYDGNIDEILYELGRCEIIVGSRFHANVIGMLMNKYILPVIYNDKTYNLLKDLDFKGPVIDINNLDAFDLADLINVDKSKIDITELVKDSYKHFYELDKILDKR